MSQKDYEKGQDDGAHGKGYWNSGSDIASQIWRSGEETKEAQEDYYKGYQNGQANKPQSNS